MTWTAEDLGNRDCFPVNSSHVEAVSPSQISSYKKDAGDFWYFFREKGASWTAENAVYFFTFP